MPLKHERVEVSPPKQHGLGVPQVLFARSFAGAASGALAAILMCPLDVVKTRQQVQAPGARSVWDTVLHVAKEEGARGFYRGLAPSLLTVPLFWGVYFPIYGAVKAKLSYATSERSGAAAWQHAHHVIAAVIAGAASDTVTNPLWVVRTRMVTPRMHILELQIRGAESSSAALIKELGAYNRICSTLKHIVQREGVLALYKGLGASFWGLAHVAIQFPIYEHLKTFLRERSGTVQDKTVSLQDLIIAASISKFCGVMFTYPHEVVRARLQDHHIGQQQYSGVVNTFRKIFRTEGVAGLYAGVQVNLFRVIPSCIVTFGAYEQIVHFVGVS